MLKTLKTAFLSVLRAGGIFRLMANSRWRRDRVLILCYHGTSLADEHLWRPYLYIHPDKLQQRLESLKSGRFSVLPLAEALQRLRTGKLPARSVVLTFDDGTYDFYQQAYPLLKYYGFPATVYQTTYYTSLQLPVFNLICSYMLWKGRNQPMADGTSLGMPGKLDARRDNHREAIVRCLIQSTARKTGVEKDAVAAELAHLLGIDYPSLKQQRILQLMNARELQEIARNGIDLQLHTHRHRTPEDESLFRKEIQDNRSVVERFVVDPPVHFCYPSGVYREAFLPWLRKENVLSATTCDSGLAERNSEMLLLPRYIDHQRRRLIEFESWTSGVGDLLALRRKSVQRPVPSLGYGSSTPP
jgi:peptidoglycan/xylan/chitin deacetylase (PgdA/CDA1 family)